MNYRWPQRYLRKIGQTRWTEIFPIFRCFCTKNPKAPHTSQDRVIHSRWDNQARRDTNTWTREWPHDEQSRRPTLNEHHGEKFFVKPAPVNISEPPEKKERGKKTHKVDSVFLRNDTVNELHLPEYRAFPAFSRPQEQQLNLLLLCLVVLHCLSTRVPFPNPRENEKA